MKCVNCQTVVKSATSTHCGQCGASTLVQQTVPAPLKTMLLPLEDEPVERSNSASSASPSRSQAVWGDWNWKAFALNAAWYLLHGMWIKGLVILALEIYFGYPAVLLAALYCGHHGNRDHAASQAAHSPMRRPLH